MLVVITGGCRVSRDSEQDGKIVLGLLATLRGVFVWLIVRESGHLHESIQANELEVIRLPLERLGGQM